MSSRSSPNTSSSISFCVRSENLWNIARVPHALSNVWTVVLALSGIMDLHVSDSERVAMGMSQVFFCIIVFLPTSSSCTSNLLFFDLVCGVAMGLHKRNTQAFNHLVLTAGDGDGHRVMAGGRTRSRVQGTAESAVPNVYIFPLTKAGI